MYLTEATDLATNFDGMDFTIVSDNRIYRLQFFRLLNVWCNLLERSWDFSGHVSFDLAVVRDALENMQWVGCRTLSL